MSKVVEERILDLNIFYREDWTPEDGTTWSETFTIEPYIRESDEYGVRNIETGVLIECDEYETAYLAKQFPEWEYGSDFWIFADEVDMPTRRIAQKLKSISLDPVPGASVLNYTNEPVTMA
jgi:hypothetical protein